MLHIFCKWYSSTVVLTKQMVYSQILCWQTSLWFAAVHDGERAFCEVVARIDSICVLAEEPASAAGRVHEAQGVEICRLVGEG